MAASNAGIQAVASSKRTESAASRVRVSRMKVDSSSGYSGGSSRVLGAPANECTTGRIVPTKRQLRSISCSGTRVSPRSPASARATRTTYRLVGQQRSTAVNERVEDASQERVVGNLLIERLALAHDGYRLARKLVDPTTKLLQFRGSSSLEERCHECQRHEAFEQAIES